MSSAEDWPTVLMWASMALLAGALLAIVQFVRNSSESQDGHDWRSAEDFRKTDSEPRRSARGFISLGLLVVVVLVTMASTALAHGPDRDRPLPPNGVLWTAEALLRDFFASSDRVGYRKVSLTHEETTQLAALTGVEPEKDAQLVYVAETGARIDGYAFLDTTGPRERAADFGVQLGADGRVERVEVMRLVDPEQQAVLDPRFLHQFEGRAFADAPRLHRKIDKPMQCGSACSAATRATRRALFLVSKLNTERDTEEDLMGSGGKRSSASTPSHKE